MQQALHFVGFTGDEYIRACIVFGRPDFIHRLNDARAHAEFAPGDTVIYANNAENRPAPFAYDDSSHQ